MKSTKFIAFKNAFIYNFFIKIMLHKMLSYGKRIMILSMTEGSPVFFVCVFLSPLLPGLYVLQCPFSSNIWLFYAVNSIEMIINRNLFK